MAEFAANYERMNGAAEYCLVGLTPGCRDGHLTLAKAHNCSGLNNSQQSATANSEISILRPTLPVCGAGTVTGPAMNVAR